MGWWATNQSWVVPAAQTAGTGLFGWIGSKKQFERNQEAQQRAYEQNLELMKYQMDYNSPKNQMARFEEAGLNKNLAYSQGDPGNWSGQRPEAPFTPYPNYGNVIQDLDIMGQYRRNELMKSQADLTNTRVTSETVKQDLQKAQRDLVKANPYMQPEYVNAMVMQLKAIAELKDQEKRFMLGNATKGNGLSFELEGGNTEIGMLKMEKQLQSLYQKFNLNSADQQVKAQIIQSKEYQNELNRIQVEWMKDGDITPQHIYLGIMMLLQRFMSK